MTIQQIRKSINDQLDAQALIYGETTTLSASENTGVTDGTANILDTVNPNHNYPPTNK